MHLLPVYDGDYLCSDAIAHHARLHGNRVAVVCEQEQLTWAELDERLNQLGNALIGLGCGKGDKICMLLPNGIPAFLVFWATVRIGCVIVPLNPMLDDAALVRLTAASDGKVLFTDAVSQSRVDALREQLPNIAPDRYVLFAADRDTPTGWASGCAVIAAGAKASPAVKVLPQDSMSIFYSSGTTGIPKGAEHSHFGRLNYCYGFGPGLGINRYTVAVCATPIYASGTMITMLPTLYYGGKIVLLPKFSAAGFFEAVATHGGTHGFMVPAMYVSVLQHDGNGSDTSTLKVLISAGQTMPMITRTQLAARFPGSEIYEVYGMTEGFFTIAIPGDFALGKRNTVGKPGFFEDIRILDDDGSELPRGETGEIVAYGPGMMKGYHARPDLTAEAVWLSPEGRTFLRSGDLGHIDADGFLYVSGRKKDMIKSGGINIFASDLEEALMAHPAVGEVAVVGVPHPRWLETPIGVVVLSPGQHANEEALLEWVNAKLSRYQRLSRIVLRSDFPRATYGKVQKDKLREEYADIVQDQAT